MRIQVKRDGTKVVRLEAWEARALDMAGSVLLGLQEQVDDAATKAIFHDAWDGCFTAITMFYNKPSKPAPASDSPATKDTK